jgi:ribonuclease HII
MSSGAKNYNKLKKPDCRLIRRPTPGIHSLRPSKPTHTHDNRPRPRYHFAMPHTQLERTIDGRVAGVDEVGRGPLAGPVFAAAVVLPRRVPRALAVMLDDSKKLDAARREAAFAALLVAHAEKTIEIGVGAASVAEIEQINILRAALLAMARAVGRLPAPPDLALIDGNQPPPLSCAWQCVVGGDGISLSIAAASIVAKVLRDRAMARLALRWPGYGWEHNAGYGTKMHCAALRRLGPTRHHRLGFAPLRQLELDMGD